MRLTILMMRFKEKPMPLNLKDFPFEANLEEEAFSFLEKHAKAYTIRMTDLAKLVNDIKFKKLDVRLLEWLQKHEEKKINVTHEEIATSLGSARVVISRTLKELEREGKVILHRGAIEVI